MNEEGGGASRSTDPASGTSSATDVSLREYLTALITATEKRSDARFEAMKETIQEAFHTAQTAIDKAEQATEKRFEGVNEFRAALSDQSRNFATTQTVDALVAKLEAQIARNRQDLDALSKRIDIRDGQTEGSRLTMGAMIALGTGGVSILGVIIVLATYLSNQ